MMIIEDDAYLQQQHIGEHIDVEPLEQHNEDEKDLID